MLAIKLQRIGRRHQPSYRVVVAEKRSKLGGPPVEDLGSYHPTTKTFACGRERLLYWLKVGARPTVTVHNLLVRHGLLSGPKQAVKIKAKAVASAESVSQAPDGPGAETQTVAS